MFAEGLRGNRTGSFSRSSNGFFRAGGGWGLAGWWCSAQVVNEIGYGIGLDEWGCSASWL